MMFCNIYRYSKLSIFVGSSDCLSFAFMKVVILVLFAYILLYVCWMSMPIQAFIKNRNTFHRTYLQLVLQQSMFHFLPGLSPIQHCLLGVSLQHFKQRTTNHVISCFPEWLRNRLLSAGLQYYCNVIHERFYKINVC